MDSFESRMNPRFLAESEKGMLWEPRVIKSGRGMVEGFKEDEKGKRRASVLSLFSLSWFSVIHVFMSPVHALSSLSSLTLKHLITGWRQQNNLKLCISLYHIFIINTVSFNLHEITLRVFAYILSTWMFLKTMTRTQCRHLSLITQVTDLIYYTTLAHNSMKDTKFKIVSTQAVRAIELLLYNFNFTDWFICYSRHVTRYKLPSQKILPPPTVSSTTTKWCRMLNLMLCQYEHNTAIRITAS